ncbi:G-protein alpha subunit-domain-containing protein [Mycena rebaudengoi]|nr:G-protein alpha subunit-domain-containing protein [Mycena rebaudengoi]
MPPLSRFDTVPSIRSWWSDSNPPGATISIHAAAKPLMRYLYHRQARELVRTNQGISLSQEVVETFASYLTHKYVSHETKALVLRNLAAKSDSKVASDAPVIAKVLCGEDNIFSDLLRSPNIEVKNSAYELLINLAHNRSAWIVCLPWTPCTPFVNVLGEQETCAFALYAIFQICKSRAGAEAIVVAQALKRIVDLDLIQSPDSNIRACILATVDHLSQHESISPAILEVDSWPQLVALAKDSYCGYVSPPPGLEIIRQGRQVHRQLEKALQVEEEKAKTDFRVKLLLLDSGDSGKSTIIKQMRLIHRPFSMQEVESYRQVIFDNLTRGLNDLLDALLDMDLEVPPAYTHVYPKDDPQGRGGYVQGWAPGECGGMNRIGDGLDEKGAKPDDLPTDVERIKNAPSLCDREPFPLKYLGPLQRLWDEEVVRVAWARGNETVLPENLQYFFSDLLRLFDPVYVPTAQDILRTRERMTGITETAFKHEMYEVLMIDVGAQSSDIRKWIHYFQDVTSILYFVSLSGYDQCLVYDPNVTQMQDTMTMWDSICNSQWFKYTSIMLLLTKDDIFQKKIKTSEIRTFFPDFVGESGNAAQGRNYFKKRFRHLAQKNGGSKDREIYIHVTTTDTDTDVLGMLMYNIQTIIIRSNLKISRLI